MVLRCKTHQTRHLRRNWFWS